MTNTFETTGSFSSFGALVDSLPCGENSWKNIICLVLSIESWNAENVKEYFRFDSSEMIASSPKLPFWFLLTSPQSTAFFFKESDKRIIRMFAVVFCHRDPVRVKMLNMPFVLTFLVELTFLKVTAWFFMRVPSDNFQFVGFFTKVYPALFHAS